MIGAGGSLKIHGSDFEWLAIIMVTCFYSLPHTGFFCTFDRNCKLVCCNPFDILFDIPEHLGIVSLESSCTFSW